MRAERVGLLALLATFGLAASAFGSGEKDLKDARAAFSKAREGTDAEALASAAARLSKADPPRGALALVELGLKGDRRSALAAQRALSSVADLRVGHALVGELAELHDARARRLLCGALGSVPGDEVSRCLARSLSDPDALVRAAAARALGTRDASIAPLVSASLRELARRDASLRVREAANGALGHLGLPTLTGFDVEELPGGLPSRFFASRVAFVLDASAPAQEARYAPKSEPGGSEAAPVASTTPPDGVRKRPAGPAPEPSSAYGMAASWVARGLQHLGDDQGFQVVQFRAAPRSFETRYVNGTARETARAIEWLKAPPSADTDRDPVRALRELLSAAVLPDEIYLYLCGLPEGRDAEAASQADELAERAWEKGIVLHVTLLEPRDWTVSTPAAADGVTQRDQLERTRRRAELHAFASQLAGTTGGKFAVALLEPFVPPVAPAGPTAPGSGRDSKTPTDAAGTAAAAETPGATHVKLVNGRVPYGELLGLRHALTSALRADGAAGAAESLARELSACPDDAAAELGLKALLSGSLPVQRAALEGFATNHEPKVHALVSQTLRTQTADPGKAFLLARALASMPGTDVAKSLALEAEVREGSGDLPRFLLASLAARPVAELSTISSAVHRATYRERHGLAAFWGRRAQDLAAGKTPVDPPALPSDRLLPERWVSGGVALLVDSQDDALQAPFFRTKEDPRTKTHERTWTRREAVLREVHRTLTALTATRASVNLLLLGESGRSWDERAQPLAKSRADEGIEFLRAQMHTVNREVGPAIEKALADTTVEEIWVLALGLPVRSDADLDVEAVRRRIAATSFRRGVPVSVVLCLGAVDPGADPAAAQADRKDELARLERYWRPLAEATGGTFSVREAISGIPDMASPPPAGAAAPGRSRPGGDVAGVASPQAPAAARGARRPQAGAPGDVAAVGSPNAPAAAAPAPAPALPAEVKPLTSLELPGSSGAPPAPEKPTAPGVAPVGSGAPTFPPPAPRDTPSPPPPGTPAAPESAPVGSLAPPGAQGR